MGAGWTGVGGAAMGVAGRPVAKRWWTGRDFVGGIRPRSMTWIWGLGSRVGAGVLVPGVAPLGHSKKPRTRMAAAALG